MEAKELAGEEVKAPVSNTHEKPRKKMPEVNTPGIFFLHTTALVSLRSLYTADLRTNSTSRKGIIRTRLRFLGGWDGHTLLIAITQRTLQRFNGDIYWKNSHALPA